VADNFTKPLPRQGVEFSRDITSGKASIMENAIYHLWMRAPQGMRVTFVLTSCGRLPGLRYVCVRLCMYVFQFPTFNSMYVCMYTRMHVCMYMYAYVICINV
jgi:hypothetical protein